MPNQRTISAAHLFQVALWFGLLIVGFFLNDGPADTMSGGHTPKPVSFYLLLTLRIVLLAGLFNLMYYWLTPLFIKGRKRAFGAYFLLIFVAYLALNLKLDLASGPPKRMEVVPPSGNQDTNRPMGPPMRERPWEFMLIPSIFLGLTVSGVAAALSGFGAYERKKQDEEEANRRRLEAELQLLKSQINPHFLLNTLNNLYALALTEPDKTPDALLKLSDMVRYILHECPQPRVPLAHDLLFIENYIDLQRLRLPPNATVRVEAPAPAEVHGNIEPMILISFIENAFKHGLTTRRPCEIEISIRQNAEQLIMVVANDIFPEKTAGGNKESGIGLANTLQRLEFSYPAKHNLHTTNDGQKHRVELTITLDS